MDGFGSGGLEKGGKGDRAKTGSEAVEGLASGGEGGEMMSHGFSPSTRTR